MKAEKIGDGDPGCGLCHGAGRLMQNPTGDHDGTCYLSCPVCQLDRLREEAGGVHGRR